ncbi:MAG TPA: PAS domain S-box protein [bacterium]|nr:PAS domain S-box protein [bacterium]
MNNKQTIIIDLLKQHTRPLIIKLDRDLNVEKIQNKPVQEYELNLDNRNIYSLFPSNINKSLRASIEKANKENMSINFNGKFENDTSTRQLYRFSITPIIQDNDLKAYSMLIQEKNRANSDTREPFQNSESKSDKYRKLIETSMDPIYVLQGRHLKLVNQAWERLFGYSREEALSKDFDITKIVAPESKQMAEQKLKVSIEKRDKISRYEFKGLTKDGKKLDIEASVTRIKWNGDFAYQGIYRDITEHKKSQKALKKGQKKYRAVFENTGSATFIIEKDMTISLINSQAENLTGFSAEEIEGKKKWTEFVTEKDRARMKKFHRMRRQSEPDDKPPEHYEFEFVDRYGNRKNMLNTIGMIPDTDKSVASFNDITKLKRTQHELKKLADRYNALYDRSNDLIFTYDFGGNFIDANPAALELFGYKREEIYSLDIFTLLADENQKDIMQSTFQELKEKGHHEQPSVYKLETKQNKTVWIESRSVVIYENNDPKAIQGIARNITHQYKMEKELKKRENEFREIFNNVNDAIYLHTIRDNNLPGKFLRINDVACNMLGYTREELLQKSPLDIDTGPPSTEITNIMGKLLEKGKITFEMFHQTKNGESIPVEVSSHLITLDRETVVLSVARNIKERKQAEAEKEKLRKEILQTQKMESIGKLAGGVAHDFNNLLTIIQGQAQVASIDLQNGEPIHDKLDEIIDASQRASTLTRQLLLFSRKQESNFEIININSTIQGLHKMLERLIGEDITIRTDLEDNLWNIYGDQGQIEQIMTNLSVNARDAIDKYGKIEISTENIRIDKSKATTVPDIKSGKYILLKIRDTGEGIPAQVKNKIFDPFFTTKGPQEGTGMGLSVVHGIVHSHGGWIDLESSVGEGTTFNIYLPATPKEDNIDKAQKGEKSLEKGQGQGILIVEDEKPLLKYVSDVLESNNYKTYTALNPKNAIQIFKEQQKEIQLLISDVIMPEMHGDELADKLKSLKPDLSVILSSGYTHEKVDRNIIKDKGYKFIQKPYDLSTLLQTTRQILE